MSPLVRALLEELCHDPGALRELADALSPLIAPPATEDRWMNTREATAYLGITLNALHKAMAARTIPCHQDRPGCKAWFKASELDAWRARLAPIGASTGGNRR